jgi:hypothetical protein
VKTRQVGGASREKIGRDKTVGPWVTMIYQRATAYQERTNARGKVIIGKQIIANEESNETSAFDTLMTSNNASV